MDKTLHKKITEKHFYRTDLAIAWTDEQDMLASMKQEMNILHFASKELLQPRPEAIAFILEKARTL